MKLKVFGGLTFVGRQQVRTVVATTSQVKAAELVGVTTSYLRSYWSVTSNPAEVEAAMSQPGVVFKSSGAGLLDFAPVTSSD